MFYNTKETENGFESITLGYNSKEDPKDNIIIKVSPENGSNLYYISFGKHEIVHPQPNVRLNTYFTGIPILFPFPNRMRDCEYTFNNKKYIQKKNNHKVFLHSLLYNEKWEYNNPVITDNKIEFETYISIDESHSVYEGFPFKHTLKMTYSISEKQIDIAYTVFNNDIIDMPFGFGVHPYFEKISGNEDTFISIPANAVMEMDNLLLPTGQLINVSETKFDLRKPVAVGRLDLDHVFTSLDKHQSVEIDYSKEKLRIRLRATDDFTHIVVYSKPDCSFICIENQTCSTDCVNMHTKGFVSESHLMILNPGERHYGEITIIPEYYG